MQDEYGMYLSPEDMPRIRDGRVVMAPAAKKRERTYEEKCVTWFHRAFEQITKAGGTPAHVLEQFTPKSIETMIRNDIHLVWIKPE